MTVHQFQRAPILGALLLSAFVSALSWATDDLGFESRTLCPTSRFDEFTSVRRVFDGDTLELRDGRRVRLLGINTPEMGHDDRPPEPFAEPARTFVESLVPSGSRVALRFDTERHDRYGRLLAHVFLPNGVNLQAELLAAGLAMTLVVPPNEWNHRCYDGLELSAREDARGLWTLDRFRPVSADRLSVQFRGFRLVTGRVERIGEGRKNLWLNLTPTVAIRIPKNDLVHFRSLPPRSLAGRRVEVRGYLERRRGELRITLRHPAALRVLE